MRPDPLILLIFAVYLPIDSWQNEVAEEIQVRGVHFTRFPSIRPYEINDFEISDRLWLANLSADFRCDTVCVLRLRPTLFYEPSPFTIFMQPVVKFGKDSLPPSNVFMNLYSADYERAWVKFHSKKFNAFIGREKFSLGPSPRYNLLLSGYAAPMDWLNFSLETEKIKFSYYLSRLDDMFTKPIEYVGDTITQYINARRYLSIRRLDFSPTPWLNLSFSEGATFGGENYALSIYHFNPIILLHTYQYNWAKDANIFFHLDSKVFFGNKSFYAALLVDDFQLERDPNGEPNHLGINSGLEFSDLFNIKKTFLIAEYTALSRYTYCHFIPCQRYYEHGSPIGAPFGPDYDEIYTRYVYHLSQRFDIYTRISYLRKGESEVETEWPIPENPRVQGTSFPADNFLSGVVQKSTNLGLGIRIFYSHCFFAEISVGELYQKNYHHKLGEIKKSPYFRLKFDLINL